MTQSITHLHVQTLSQSLEIALDTGTVTMTDLATRQALWMAPTLSLFAPVLDNVPVALTLIGGKQQGQEILLRFASELLEDFMVRICAHVESDALDISCSFQTRSAAQLNQLLLFPTGTIMTPYEIVNFRNRHFTSHTYPEMNLGGEGCTTDTYSGDWQFAPHPTMCVFRKLDASMFFGALDLPQAFGMYIAIHGYRVDHCYLDYGSSPYGQPLAAGERFTSPRFRCFVRHGVSHMETLDTFADMLITEGLIPNPAKKHRERWWQEPLYCTWVDQYFSMNAVIPDDLRQQMLQPADNVYAACTEDLVRRAAAVITREQLPFRTILLDEGWAVTRGQWEPDSSRFPDLRQLVDDLHEQGFKVVVWWSWAEISDDAVVNPAHLIGRGKLNRHGKRMRDYSSPATQKEYLQPLFHTLFSSDPGCYNLDGVKTDFLADKVHPDMPVADPTWRGEENYFLHITRLFYREMKRHKPDAVHIGCAGHFWLAEWIDINRTFDVASSNYLEHEARAEMLRHTTPGCPVAYDFHIFQENMAGYFASARTQGAAIQIGNILYTKANPFTSPVPADSGYYESLHCEFAAVECTRSV